MDKDVNKDVFSDVQRVYYYSIYDNIAEEFLPMFPAKTDADAVRTFLHGMPKEVNKNDFSLFYIGLFKYDKQYEIDNAEFVSSVRSVSLDLKE